ncbi:hypothetical protein [Nonomuraea maritima]|nr:hypothetical protein [Nonomuraea maritima]
MDQHRGTAVRPGLPGDVHWYDVPDDDVEPGEETSRRRRRLWRRWAS